MTKSFSPLRDHSEYRGEYTEPKPELTVADISLISDSAAWPISDELRKAYLIKVAQTGLSPLAKSRLTLACANYILKCDQLNKGMKHTVQGNQTVQVVWEEMPIDESATPQALAPPAEIPPEPPQEEVGGHGTSCGQDGHGGGLDNQASPQQ